MFKRITLITKKPELTRDDFIAYYEKKHLPLCMSLLPAPFLHRRNYPLPGQSLTVAIGTAADVKPPAFYDCISEVIHQTQDDATAYLDRMKDSEVARLISEDAAKFVAPGGFVGFIVEVHELNREQLTTL